MRGRVNRGEVGEEDNAVAWEAYDKQRQIAKKLYRNGEVIDERLKGSKMKGKKDIHGEKGGREWY